MLKCYYVADKFFDVKAFDITIHTGVGTKLSTYHVFAGLTFTFGNRMGEIQHGFNLATQQTFLDYRLISRVQLTSFFSGTEAIMQNISGSVGYRPVVPEEFAVFQDIEFSYALSFLS
jgi:hypothetical protein